MEDLNWFGEFAAISHLEGNFSEVFWEWEERFAANFVSASNVDARDESVLARTNVVVAETKDLDPLERFSAEHLTQIYLIPLRICKDYLNANIISLPNIGSGKV